ncbi:DUF262 domain-containing protein [Aliarcobacter cryaerophilus]|uniref:DUF262 domain-containing protein n=1 Tax=Aliarcobacter cryaerophilus TaxID=28198 RepID=UPI0021B4B62C|nr:DUF262 domain-containing HNH endonuclease family protein [Aliarcobacter cryaerophilus]MCT7499907.1 DUF262 domain-containing HNH endonuclease family protein [Aliarcobacter cryaerophilus]MCT7544102.1 DUF262 domain-containing HNH endonuclease family protein [Aliarcobacter cryaerophilus]
MDAGKRTINDIFNGNRILEIPFFQRAYVWDMPQWERLLEDMKNVSLNNKPYFLGSVILKQQPTNMGDMVGDRRTLIDGQQRLTTLSIFFKVLSLKLDDDYEFNRMFKIRNLIAIQHNHNDIAAYEKVMNLKTLEDLNDKDNITRAYNYFKNNLNINELNINNILSKILFVGIDLSENEDEQQIFDTINSLGVRLTTAELLKNYFFNRDEITTYNTYWKDVFEKDSETKNYWDTEITAGRAKREFIDIFFFSYLQIKIQEKELKVKTENKIEFSKVENLFESYKSFIREYFNNDKELILSEIKEYASLFQKNFNIKIVENELTNISGIERINAIIFGLDTTTLIPYVLFVLKNVLDDTVRNELFEFLETYIMRRIICNQTTKNYNQLFTDRLINNKILSKEAFVNYLNGQLDTVNFLPTDEDLENGFTNMILVNKQSAGVLYFIESKIRNRSYQSTQLLGLNKYSLEHLMPKKWENHWVNSMSSEEKMNRNKKLLTLGNLTIITQSLNSTIRDANWKNKKEGRGDKKGLLAYASGLETMNHYLTFDEWNEKTIEDRANFLFEKAKNIWKI